MYPQIEFLGRQIGSYGLFAVLGLFACGITGIILARKVKIMYEDIILSMAAIGIGLLLGGHLLYGVTRSKEIFLILKNAPRLGIKQTFLLFAECFGGMVYYGGFLGGAAALFITSGRSKTMKREVIFDIYAVSIPLFHFFGRIGCFFAGCCYGIESDFGFIVHDNHIQPDINDVVRFPVQLVEAGCNLIIFIVLCIMFLKKRKKQQLIYVYLLLYPVIRFTLEFFRGDEIRGKLFFLSTSQWISLILFSVAVWGLFMKKMKIAVTAGLFVFLLINGVFGPKSNPELSNAKIFRVEAAIITDKEKIELESESMSTGTDTMTTGTDSLSTGTEAIPETGESSTDEEDDSESQKTEEDKKKEKFERDRSKFFVIFSIVFALLICIAAALWGTPELSLKQRYRANRKKRKREEKQRLKLEKEKKNQDSIK